jgi:hypothetical protein
MIGVLAKPDQAAVVEEFFQLFKTPWEVFRGEHSYDVIIASSGDVPDVKPRLMIVIGTESTAADTRFGFSPQSVASLATLNYRGKTLPLYTGVLTFAARPADAFCAIEDGRPASIRLRRPGMTILRLGYDLFKETEQLLVSGQPPEWAGTATLDAHIQLLREWILEEGIPLVEIPPSPSGYPFSVCLTHDIDFIGIKWHRFDHTMWGFLARATLGSLRRLVKGDITFGQCFRSWLAVLSLPLVYVGWAGDFWFPFAWYLNADKGLRSTYYLIPFKNRPGDNIHHKHANWRSSKYDITDITDWMATLLQAGCEVGVHGIDSWHSVERARAEIERVRKATGQVDMGIRMHWLLGSEKTPMILEAAGYSYDSSSGYNEAVGYRCGTAQVNRPIGAKALLELPVLIQDGALFYPGRLGLSRSEAWETCLRFIRHAHEDGGVLTLIWHDRSPHPERFWGEFYLQLLDLLKSMGAWFGTASQVVDWYRRRREVTFSVPREPRSASKVILSHRGGIITPPLRVRIHHPVRDRLDSDEGAVESRDSVDLEWSGESSLEIDLADTPEI